MGPNFRSTKAEALATLRSRRLGKADWVDRELLLIIDAPKHGSLLRMLHIDPAAVSGAPPTVERRGAKAGGGR